MMGVALMHFLSVRTSHLHVGGETRGFGFSPNQLS